MESLQRERRPDRSCRSPCRQAVLALLRSADHVQRGLAAVVEPEGITLQQYHVLRILREAGDQALPTLEIGRRMIEQTPGITRLLDRLEAKRLASRIRCPRDRRQVLCSITVAGQALLSRLEQPMRQANLAALAPLRDDEQRTLTALLERVRTRTVDSPTTRPSIC